MDCVILTSGKATRLYPLTIDTPKVLLNIGNRKIIDDILDKVLKLSFIDKIIFSSSNEQLDLYLKNNPKYKDIYNRITVIPEPNAIGVIKTLGLIKPYVTTDDFLLIFPDELFISEIKNVNKMYKNSLANHLSVGVRKMNKHAIGSYSRLEFNNNKVCYKIIEKPQDHKAGLSTIGRYIMPRVSLDYLDESQKSISDLLNACIDHGYKLRYNFYKGKRFDTGQFEGYNQASKYFKKGTSK